MHEHTELDSARRCAGELSIPLHEVDCTDLFNSIVRSNFISEYLSGRTPNPCIICNQHVKLARLYAYAMEHGFDMIATGHYAKVERVTQGDSYRYAVSMSKNRDKDQSYMLYRLSQDVLSRLLLPLGDLKKDEVREGARIQGISAASSRDSQEICFLPEGNHADYIESVSGKSPEGSFIDEKGNCLGVHKGIVRYTVGQRKGLGIALGQRMFVSAIDPVLNTVTLSPGIRGKKTVELTGVFYQGMAPLEKAVRAVMDVKVRYSAPIRRAECELRPDGTATLTFEEEVVSAPGQSAVLYSEGRVMLGGFIA